VNSPGTIDSDYSGELIVGLINLSKDYYSIDKYDRIAQLVFAPVARAEFCNVTELEKTVRGAGGFGSTGK
jgi:dUTP pyrophosphatase